VAAGAGANTRFGGNLGASARGASPGRGFGTQQNQPGFNAPINQRFNRSNQNPFDQDNRSFNQGGQGSFNQNGQGSFSQGMQNQGSFGLGNGNRSSFFDNQPFNTQGFGRGIDGGAGAENFADPDDANFQNDAFESQTDSQFDSATEQGSFRGQQFDDSQSPVTEPADQNRGGVFRAGPGFDHSFRDPSDPIGFEGASSLRAPRNDVDGSEADERSTAPQPPAENRGGVFRAGPGFEHGFRDPSDPIGFEGASSLRAPRNDVDGSEADEQAIGEDLGAGRETQNTSGGRRFDSTDTANRPNSIDGPTSAMDQNRRLGTPSTAQGTLTQDEAFRQRTPANSAQASQVGRFRQPGSQASGRPRGNGVFDFPPPPGVRNWLDGSADYGFMRQYTERPGTVDQDSGVRNSTEARPARPVGQGTQDGAGSPNYFNGTYSRSRL
jgi:hypothetical protein